MKRLSPTTFLGNQARQTREAFMMWEQLLTSLKFKRIIELGTFPGSLSLYFYLFCFERDAQFYTFDIKKYKDSPLKNQLPFGMSFYKQDIFQSEVFIKKLIAEKGLTVLFCDNGDKIKEFKLFASALKLGDIIGVHDWEVEIKTADIKETCRKQSLEITFLNWNDPMLTYTQLFKKI